LLKGQKSKRKKEKAKGVSADVKYGNEKGRSGMWLGGRRIM
jgi:hypothetical protein